MDKVKFCDRGLSAAEAAGAMAAFESTGKLTATWGLIKRTQFDAAVEPVDKLTITWGATEIQARSIHGRRCTDLASVGAVATGIQGRSNATPTVLSEYQHL